MLHRTSNRNRFLVIDETEEKYRQIREIMDRQRLLDDGRFSIDVAHDIEDALDHLYNLRYTVCFIEEQAIDESRSGRGLQALESFKRHHAQTPTVLLVDSDRFELEPATIDWLESGLVRVLPSHTLCWTDIQNSVVDLLHQRAVVLVVNRYEDQYFFIADMLVRYPELSFEPEWARGLDDAVEKLMHRRFDLVVLDQDLGEARGTDLAVRMHELGFEQPTIMCTGRERIALDEQALRLLGRRRLQFISRARVAQEGASLPLLCARQLRLR